jgi:hypothetical protein
VLQRCRNQHPLHLFQRHAHAYKGSRVIGDWWGPLGHPTWYHDDTNTRQSLLQSLTDGCANVTMGRPLHFNTSLFRWFAVILDTLTVRIFQQIRKHCGHVDLALIPIGAYEPRWFMAAAARGSRRSRSNLA